MYNLCTSLFYGVVGGQEMALKGNLRDFSVTQLLNLVNVAHKTGTLIIERSQEQVFVSFRDGKLAFARDGADAASLTVVLYHAKKLNAAQVRAINERSVGMSDKELGLLLINSNYITQQEILSSLQSHYLNMVNRLFTWSEGLVRVDSELLPPNDKITVRINLENLIIDGTRKMREWEQLQGEIPSLDMALKFSERPGVNLKALSLSVDEWKVISFVNPKNTIHQIAKATNKNDLEIRRIVYSFIQAGLVEMVRPEGRPVQPASHSDLQSDPPLRSQLVQPKANQHQTYQPQPLQAQTLQPVRVESAPLQPVQIQPRISLPQSSKPEFKSLINRIINRIRSI
jgi:hypothetical protein